MLKERARLIAVGVFLTDLMLVAVAFFVAYWLRGVLLPRLGVTGPLYPLVDYLLLLPLALVIWGVLLALSNRYRSARTVPLQRRAWEAFKTSAVAAVLFILAIYLFRLDAALLGGRPGSAFYVGRLDAPQVLQRPQAEGTEVHWRAAAHASGGKFLLYAGPENGEMELVAEQEAKTGMSDYSVTLPAVAGATYRFELRYSNRAGNETVLQSVLVHDLISRSLILLIGLLATALLVAETLLIRLAAQIVRQRGYNYRRVVIVGTGPAALEIQDLIHTHPDWGLKVSGFVTVDEEPLEAAQPLLGSYRDLPEMVETTVVDQVIFAAERQRFDELEDLVLQLEELGIETAFALNLFPNTRAKAQLGDMAGTPLVTFSSGPTDQLQLYLKRAIDFSFAAIALVLLSPLIALIALLIKVTSRGPVLFRQERCGLNGRRFRLYKFRTMIEGAERQQRELEALNEMNGPVFKLAHDPRVTPVGRILRKFSLDELPQLWNVVAGDMSLVGPRPPVPQEVVQYERWQRRRLSMRPGLTCLWQISGRNQVDFDRWMELDLEYIDSWSPRLDLKILLKTIPAVLSGRGAS